MNIKTAIQQLMICILFLTQQACVESNHEQQLSRTTVIGVEDSCVIAMISHQGEAKEDREINKYQELLTAHVNSLVNLEKLGWAYVNKAKTSFDPGYYKLAEQTVSCMDKLQAGSLQAMLLQGHVLHNLHHFKEAEYIARQLVALRGYWYDYGLLGDTLMEQGDLSSAIKSYQEMMNQNPGQQAYNRAAYIRWLKGDVEGAIDLLTLSVSAHAGQNNSSAAWTLTRLADYHYQTGHFDLANQYLTQVLQQQPDYAPALLLMGNFKMAQGVFDEAVVLLTKAEELNPLPEYRWALIEAMAGNDGLKQQRLALQRQLLQTGATEDSRTYALYLASTAIDPEKSLSLAKDELQLRKDVMTLDTYAWALRSNKQLQQAQQYTNLALREGTKSARLFYHSGVIALENGQQQQAIELLKQAKTLEYSLWPSERKHLNQIL